ncbi:carboxypeptidase-like regulatory domain-containing protein [Corallococcus sp. M34]|nr:carboxypeptidase-like regulatory domain-containing protein [Citreicoccus inhibens]
MARVGGTGAKRRRGSWRSGILGLLLLAGCDDAPRGSRTESACQPDPLALHVEVVAADGALVRGATVVATNLDSNVSITALTNDHGVTTAIDEVLAPGPLHVVATAGSKTSSAVRVEWTCDPCHCAPVPPDLRLQLSE